MERLFFDMGAQSRAAGSQGQDLFFAIQSAACQRAGLSHFASVRSAAFLTTLGRRGPHGAATPCSER